MPLERFAGQFSTSSRIIEASFSKTRSDVELLQFGMHQVLEKDVEYFSNQLAQSANDHLDPELNFSRHCKWLFDGANELERLDNITVIEHRQRQGSSSLGEPQRSHTAWDNIPSTEHKCFINETYQLLLQLFQGPMAYCKPFLLALPFPILSPWFFHHSVGNVAVCFLPPNIRNDETWVGLELYVYCGGRRCYPVVLEVDLYAHGKRRLHTYPRQHKTCEDDFVVLHVPRKYFSEELNDCEGISAFVKPANPEVEVKMCGTRLLYEQYSDFLSKGIIEAVLCRPDLLLYLNKTVKGILQKDKSDGDEWEMPKSSRVATHEPRERDALKSFQNLMTNTEQVAKEVSTILHKHRKEYAENRAVDGFDSVVLHSKESFLANWDRIEEDTSKNLSHHFNHFHIMAETLLCASDSQNQIKAIKDLLTIFFEHRVLVTLSLKGHIAFFLRHFYPSSPYNLCFPQKEIPDWLKPQINSSMVGIELPPGLSNDNSWRGLVICSAFSVKEHPNSFSKGSFRLLCHLTSEGSCLNAAAYCSVTKDKIKWLHLRSFIWLTYIPRVMLTELDGKRIVEARVYNYCPGLTVDKCSICLLYEEHVKKLKENIIQCCTSFVEDLHTIDQFLESEDDEDLPYVLSTETGGTNDDQALPLNSYG